MGTEADGDNRPLWIEAQFGKAPPELSNRYIDGACNSAAFPLCVSTYVEDLSRLDREFAV